MCDFINIGFPFISFWSVKAHLLQDDVERYCGGGQESRIKILQQVVLVTEGVKKMETSDQSPTSQQLCQTHQIQAGDGLISSEIHQERGDDVLYQFLNLDLIFKLPLTGRYSSSRNCVSSFPHHSRSSSECSLWCWNGLTREGSGCFATWMIN